MNSSMPDFYHVQRALDSMQAMTGPCEAHGTLCGLLIGRHDFPKWIEFTLDSNSIQADSDISEPVRVLQELYDFTKTALNGAEMSLQILLPDENSEFATRLIGLGSWCQGFLFGLGVSGESISKSLSAQGLECMDDLLQISQISHDDKQSEESETVYAEIVEHVRLSAIYMNEECNPVSPAPAMQ